VRRHGGEVGSGVVLIGLEGGTPNNALHLTAPLGAARAGMEASPRARHSASAGAAGERECSADGGDVSDAR
jgi:hypothetical protein